MFSHNSSLSYEVGYLSAELKSSLPASVLIYACTHTLQPHIMTLFSVSWGEYIYSGYKDLSFIATADRFFTQQIKVVFVKSTSHRNKITVMLLFLLFSPLLQGLYGLQVRYNQPKPSSADIFDSTQLLSPLF